MELGDIAIKVEGVWLPKDEQHMLHWMTKGKKAHRRQGKITYQWQKQEAAMGVADQFMPGWRGKVFVDVGGHCGFWSMWWGLVMDRVVAFEPIDYLRTIYAGNMPGDVNYMLLPYALADKEGVAVMRLLPENTGATRMFGPNDPAPDEHIKTPNVQVKVLDTILPAYLDGEPMGVLKIDCEGFEEKVVRGGEKIIREHRPMVVVEQKFEGRHFDFEEQGAVHLLEKWGWRTQKVLAGDHIMVHEDYL